MPKQKPLTDAAGEVREISAKDMEKFEDVDTLPDSLRRKIGVRGPQKKPTKERITIRLSPEVLRRFRATGDGWQSRMDEALQDWLSKRKSVA